MKSLANLFLVDLEAGEALLVFSSGSSEAPPMTVFREVPSGLRSALGTAALVGWQTGEADSLLSFFMSAGRTCFSLPPCSPHTA